MQSVYFIHRYLTPCTPHLHYNRCTFLNSWRSVNCAFRNSFQSCEKLLSSGWQEETHRVLSVIRKLCTRHVFGTGGGRLLPSTSSITYLKNKQCYLYAKYISSKRKNKEEENEKEKGNILRANNKINRIRKPNIYFEIIPIKYIQISKLLSTYSRK